MTWREQVCRWHEPGCALAPNAIQVGSCMIFHCDVPVQPVQMMHSLMRKYNSILDAKASLMRKYISILDAKASLS